MKLDKRRWKGHNLEGNGWRDRHKEADTGQMISGQCLMTSNPVRFKRLVTSSTVSQF
jgi:hypothetical protein